MLTNFSVYKLPIGLFLLFYLTPVIALPINLIGIASSPNLVLGILLTSIGIVAITWKGLDIEKPDSSPWTWFAIFIWTWCSFRAFLWLIWESKEYVMILSPFNLGDISLHLGLIEYLQQVSFWPEGQILEGPLQYPIGSDYFNSLLGVIGVETFAGLRWTGLILALITGYFLYLWKSGFAIILFIAGAGFSGITIITGEKIDELFWKNPFLTMLVTQRGLLWAIPAGILLLIQWSARGSGRNLVLPVWLEIVIYSTLPLYSVHTFIAFSIIAAVFSLQSLNELPHWLVVGACSILPASTLMWFISGGFRVSSVTLSPGWLFLDKDVWFWIWNFGLMIPIITWSYINVFIVRTKEVSWHVQTTALASAILLAIVMTFSFAKWEWDNTKMLIWVWILLFPAIWYSCFQPIPVIFRCTLLLGLCFSGIITLFAGLDGRHGYSVIKRSEYYQAKKILANLIGRPRILCAPDYNQPAILAGYPVYVGFEGHLWSHGLDYKHTLKLLDNVMQQGPGWVNDARLLSARYILWGPKENEKYERNWEGKAIYEEGPFKLFKLEN